MTEHDEPKEEDITDLVSNLVGAMLARDKIIFQPPSEAGWSHNQDLLDALDALNDERHAHKMRNTILALVAARLASRPEESVWDMDHTASRTTYHMKWKHNPRFVAALQTAERVARTWTDSQATDALRRAQLLLSLNTEAAVLALLNGLTEPDPKGRRLSATAILDRADIKTASKSASAGTLAIDLETAIARIYGEKEEQHPPALSPPAEE